MTTRLNLSPLNNLATLITKMSRWTVLNTLFFTLVLVIVVGAVGMLWLLPGIAIGLGIALVLPHLCPPMRRWCAKPCCVMAWW